MQHAIHWTNARHVIDNCKYEGLFRYFVHSFVRLSRPFVLSFVRQLMCMFFCLFVCMFVCMFVRLFVCLFVGSSVRSFIHVHFGKSSLNSSLFSPEIIKYMRSKLNSWAMCGSGVIPNACLASVGGSCLSRSRQPSTRWVLWPTCSDKSCISSLEQIAGAVASGP